jgi:hypothetical protein
MGDSSNLPTQLDNANMQNMEEMRQTDQAQAVKTTQNQQGQQQHRDTFLHNILSKVNIAAQADQDQVIQAVDEKIASSAPSDSSKDNSGVQGRDALSGNLQLRDEKQKKRTETETQAIESTGKNSNENKNNASLWEKMRKFWILSRDELESQFQDRIQETQQEQQEQQEGDENKVEGEKEEYFHPVEFIPEKRDQQEIIHDMEAQQNQAENNNMYSTSEMDKMNKLDEMKDMDHMKHTAKTDKENKQV